MGIHNIIDQLSQADLPTSGVILKIPGVGALVGWGPTVPSANDIYAPSAIFFHTDGSADDQLYVNEGTLASVSFTVVGSVG